MLISDAFTTKDLLAVAAHIAWESHKPQTNTTGTFTQKICLNLTLFAVDGLLDVYGRQVMTELALVELGHVFGCTLINDRLKLVVQLFLHIL